MTQREAGAIGTALGEGIVNGEDDDQRTERVLWNTALVIVRTTGMDAKCAYIMGKRAFLSDGDSDQLATHAGTHR